jgi:hypothetical protein
MMDIRVSTKYSRRRSASAYRKQIFTRKENDTYLRETVTVDTKRRIPAVIKNIGCLESFAALI